MRVAGLLCLVCGVYAPDITSQTMGEDPRSITQPVTDEEPAEKQDEDPRAAAKDSEFNFPDRYEVKGAQPSWTDEPPWWWLTPPWWVATPPLWSKASRSADPNGPWAGDATPARVDVSFMELAERVDATFAELSRKVYAFPLHGQELDQADASADHLRLLRRLRTAEAESQTAEAREL